MTEEEARTEENPGKGPHWFGSDAAYALFYGETPVAGSKGKPESTVVLVSLRDVISPAGLLQEWLEGELGKGKVEVVELASPGAPSENDPREEIRDMVRRGLVDPTKVMRLPAPVVVSDLLGYTRGHGGPVGDAGNTEDELLTLARIVPDAKRAAASDYLKTLVNDAATETTRQAKATPRLKWEHDRRDDDNPATFAWRAYAAEAEAGKLHRGVIGQEDKPLAVKLASWLRSHPMPEGIDIPTKPDWITRQADAGKAKASYAPRPRTEGQRVYDALASRRYRARHGSPEPV